MQASRFAELRVGPPVCLVHVFSLTFYNPSAVPPLIRSPEFFPCFTEIPACPAQSNGVLWPEQPSVAQKTPPESYIHGISLS